jgi:hypothetical protein
MVGMTQVIDCLTSKHKVMSSKPNTALPPKIIKAIQLKSTKIKSSRERLLPQSHHLYRKCAVARGTRRMQARKLGPAGRAE